jgi:hypothetical protein
MLVNEPPTKNKNETKDISGKESKENGNENRNIILDKRYNILGNCRSVGDFEKIEEIGEGTYGRVCKKN